MKVVGLDLSLRATGFCVDGRSMGTLVREGKLPKDASEIERVERLGRISKHVLIRCGAPMRIGNEISADLVVIEDYAFSRADAHAHALGELGGVVRLRLYWAGIPFVVVKSTTLKKYATGKGNAGKDEVLAVGARKHAGITNNNEADAYFLWLMAADHYDLPGKIPMPKKNREALEVVDWPSPGARTERGA